MREGMNLFHTFAHWLWGNYFYQFADYENPIKYIWRVYKIWGFKCFVKDQFYWPAYKAGFRLLHEVMTGNKRS